MDITVNMLAVNIVYGLNSVATPEILAFHASEVGPYGEAWARHTFDILRDAVGGNGFTVVFVEVLRKWIAVNNDVHNNMRDIWNDSHDAGDREKVEIATLECAKRSWSKAVVVVVNEKEEDEEMKWKTGDRGRREEAKKRWWMKLPKAEYLRWVMDYQSVQVDAHSRLTGSEDLCWVIQQPRDDCCTVKGIMWEDGQGGVTSEAAQCDPEEKSLSDH
jgi:hypothetical protein